MNTSLNKSFLRLAGLGLSALTLALASPAIAQLNLTNGLVAYYPFTNSFADATGNGYNGINNGAIFSPDRFGISNSAASFNGVTAYVRINNNRFMDGSTNLTFSLWYYWNGSQNGQLIGSGDSRNGQDPISTRIGTTGFEDFGICDTVQQRRTGFSGHREIYTNSMWRQMVVVHAQTGVSNSATTVYLQGSAIATAKASRLITLTYDRNMQTRIGAMDSPFSGNDQHWKGDIDDVRFYNRAFSAAEVWQLFAAEAPVSVSPASTNVNYLNPVTFTATVNSNLPTSSLQWYLGTNPVPGATGPTLTINSVQPTNAGNYTVRATNVRGSFDSNPARLSFVAITNTIVYDLIARMDGSQDSLIFRGGTLQWDHVSGGAGAPGRSLGLDVPTTISSTLNGVQVMNKVDWIPTWPLPVPDEIRFDAVSSVFTNLMPPIPTSGIQSIVSTNVSARGSLTVTQVPDATNNNTLLVNYADAAIGSGFVTGRVTIVSFAAPTGPPVITRSPSDFHVPPGTSVSFDVDVAGPVPFTYQWRFNGINISGATNATLELDNVQSSAGGFYSVLVGNAFSSVLSSAAYLEVFTPPVVDAQPIGTTNLAGDTVSFTVSASGSTPLFYQWQFNGVDVPGAIASTLTLDAVTVTSAGNYSVTVSNAAGVAVSSNAVLAVRSGPVIITPPAARIVDATAPVSFTVAALGDAPFTYQWRLNGTNITGATGPTYAIGAATPSHSGLYSVAVSNALGATISSSARLSVLPLSVVVPWAAAAGGPGTDAGNAIAVDAAGNSVVVGYFTGTATFGTNTLTSAGNTDIFIARYNPAGQVLWVRRAGGTGYDVAKGVALDTGGNIYVTGAYEGVADFGTSSLTNTTVSSFSDIFLARYDAAGNLAWARSAGAEFAHDEGTAVAVDGAGNVLVAGRSVLETFAGAPVANAGRILVAKFTSAGAEVWAWKAGSYSGGNLDTATGVAGDAAGNVLITGTFHSPLAAFGGGTFTNRGNADIFVAKLNAAGALQWARQAGGAGEDTASGVALAADGSAYVAGATGGAASFSGTNVTSLAGAYSDGFVAKYAGDGSVTWVRQFGGAGVAAARGLAVDAAGTVHLTGYFSGAASFGTNNLNGIIGSYDAFLSRLDAAGNVAFAQQAGGADLSGDFGLGVGVDGAGNSIITGYFSGTNSAGGTTLPSRGAEDVLLTRFNQFVGGGVPALGFQRIGAQLRMRWPLASSSYILQSATNLLAPVWVDETNTLNLSGTDLETDVPVGNKVRFYRLRKP